MKETKRKRRNDILLFAGSLLAGILLFFAPGAVKNESGQVLVIFDGQVVETFPLDEYRETKLEYNGYNLLIIEDGYASVTQADCPDKLCVKQPRISKSGETIICLPHKVIIKTDDDEN